MLKVEIQEEITDILVSCRKKSKEKSKSLLINIRELTIDVAYTIQEGA